MCKCMNSDFLHLSGAENIKGFDSKHSEATGNKRNMKAVRRKERIKTMQLNKRAKIALK